MRKCLLLLLAVSALSQLHGQCVPCASMVFTTISILQDSNPSCSWPWTQSWTTTKTYRAECKRDTGDQGVYWARTGNISFSSQCWKPLNTSAIRCVGFIDGPIITEDEASRTISGRHVAYDMKVDTNGISPGCFWGESRPQTMTCTLWYSCPQQ